MDPEKVYPFLDNIIRIKAVQDFTPSRAISFIFLLKKVIREELGNGIHEVRISKELFTLESRIDDLTQSRCAVLAAANPKLGRFDEFIPMHEQINIPPALLSRFDLIFSILDKPNRKTDTDLTSHILQSHKGGEIHEHMKKTSDNMYSKSQESMFLKHVLPVFEPEFLRKYVAYAKRNVFPVMMDDALEILQNYYVDFRSSSKDSVPFTPRQLEAFVRLAESSARIRLSQEANVEDAKRAILIIDQYLRRVGTDRETGKFDIDIESWRSLCRFHLRTHQPPGDGPMRSA